MFIGGEVDGLDGVVDEAGRRRSARLRGHGSVGVEREEPGVAAT